MQKDEEFLKAKAYLKSVTNIKTFNELIENCILQEDEIKILKMRFIEFKDHAYIADTLNFSISTIKRKQNSALKKLYKTII